jgi:hypothetical protein
MKRKKASYPKQALRPTHMRWLDGKSLNGSSFRYLKNREIIMKWNTFRKRQKSKLDTPLLAKNLSPIAVRHAHTEFKLMKNTARVLLSVELRVTTESNTDCVDSWSV